MIYNRSLKLQIRIIRWSKFISYVPIVCHWSQSWIENYRTLILFIILLLFTFFIAIDFQSTVTWWNVFMKNKQTEIKIRKNLYYFLLNALILLRLMVPNYYFFVLASGFFEDSINLYYMTIIVLMQSTIWIINKSTRLSYFHSTTGAKAQVFTSI